MKKKKSIIKFGVSIAIIMVMLFSVITGCDLQVNDIPETLRTPFNAVEGESGAEMCITFDENGAAKAISGIKSAYMNLSEPSPGKYVLEVNLNPGNGKHRYRSVMFSIYNDGNPSGYSINIGDSATCNGFGGDAGTQSNDAELQVHNNTFQVFGNDAYTRSSEYDGKTRAMNLYSNDGDSNPKATYDFLTNSTSTPRRIRIANNSVGWWEGLSFQAETYMEWLYNPYLFSLDSSYDSEGPRNETIYAAFNRSIYSSSRTGTGITTVYVYLENLDYPTPAPTKAP